METRSAQTEHKNDAANTHKISEASPGHGTGDLTSATGYGMWEDVRYGKPSVLLVDLLWYKSVLDHPNFRDL